MKGRKDLGIIFLMKGKELGILIKSDSIPSDLDM